MSISIDVSRRDLEKLDSLLTDISKYTKINTDNLVQQTILFAVKSAANATNPKSSLNPQGRYRKLKLGDKYLLRPLVKLPESMGFWYYQLGVYKPFKVSRKLTNRELKAKNLKRITKAVKMWNRKDGGWKYLPYPGEKRNKSDKRFRIPHAGLAKAAWYRAAAGMDQKFTYQELKRNRRVRGIHSSKRAYMFAEIVNKVKYASKTSPGAARYGLRMATNKMRGSYLPKIDKAIERNWNSLGRSLNKAIKL